MSGPSVSDDFCNSQFFDLPWPVLENIFLFLSDEFVLRYLIHVPELYDFIVWYAQRLEIYMQTSEHTRYYHPSLITTDPRKFHLVGYNAICSFFASHPQIVPQCFKVLLQDDFELTNFMLQTFFDHISRAARLEVILMSQEMSSEDAEMLFTFPNLWKLQAQIYPLSPNLDTLSHLPLLKSLKELRIRFDSYIDPLIELPPHLESLDLHIKRDWFAMNDMSGEVLRRVFSSQRDLAPAVFTSLVYPERLKALALDTMWETINVSHLPPALESVRLTTNLFVYDRKCPRWPVTLKSITLATNKLDDSSLTQLVNIQWPPHLKTLRLTSNDIDSLNGLTNVPVGLEHFELSWSPIRSLKVTHNLDSYGLFRFPHSLVSLSLRNCNNIHWEEGHSGGRISLQNRIILPPNLETFDLSYCNLQRLTYFALPTSLKSLILTGNQISNLNTYNLKAGKKHLCSWKQLENLTHLTLKMNRLKNLNDWYPPKSLTKLDLSFNKIKRLVTKLTPLFQESFRKITNEIQHLRLQGNIVYEIDPTLHLPCGLITLDLSSNKLSEFQFFDSLASHKMLRHLNLEANTIRRIGTCYPAFPHVSNLKRLDFEQDILSYHDSPNGEENYVSAEDVFEMTANEFYEVLGLIGLTPAERKEYIMREHLFQ